MDGVLDLHIDEPRTRQLFVEIKELLSDRQVMLCLGNRATLSAFATSSIFSDRVVAAVTTEQEGIDRACHFRPDLILISEQLERGYGIRLLQQLKQELPSARLLIFLQRETSSVVQEAMEAGADGVMFNSSLGTGRGDFIMALRAMAEGRVHYPKKVRELLSVCGSSEKLQKSRDALSDRELQVVAYVARGFRNTEIAEALIISSETVKSHISTAIQKLGVRDRTQLAVQAILHGWIKSDEEIDVDLV